MKNIPKYLKYTLKLILAAWPLILIGLIIWNDLYPSHCLEHGGVWDYKQMKCRKDCIKWNWKHGCIPLPIDEIQEQVLNK